MFFTAFNIKAQINRVVLIFPFSLQTQGRGRAELNTRSAVPQLSTIYFATDFWRTGV